MEKDQERDKRPEFSVVEVRCTDPVKDGDSWRATATTLVKQRSDRPPDPPKDVIFFVDGTQAGNHRTTDENGRAEAEVIFVKPGRHYVETQIAGTSFSKGTTVLIEEKKKESKRVEAVETTAVELEPGKWMVAFAVFDHDDNPISGAIVEVFDRALEGGRKKLDLTDGAGVTSYQIEMLPEEKGRYFVFRSGTVHRPQRIWR